MGPTRRITKEMTRNVKGVCAPVGPINPDGKVMSVATSILILCYP
jgi:hypothetical protein